MPRHSLKKAPFLAFALAALSVTVLYYVLHILPFGPQALFTGDMNAQYLPFFSHFRTALQSGEGWAYATDKALGGSTAGLFAYHAANPLLLLFLIFPVTAYPLLLSIVLLLKISLAAAFAAFFFQYRFDAPDRIAALGGLCYALCGYVAAYQQNLMWFTPMELLPLICWGICLLLRRRRVLPYVLTLGLAILSNFYIGYMVCLFCVLYFVFELLLADGFELRGAVLWDRGWRFAACSLLAGGVACLVLLPCLGDVLHSKTGGDFLMHPFSGTFPLSAFFRRLAPGSFEWAFDIPDYEGDYRVPMPNVYCGVLCVIGVLLFFAAKEIRLREKLLGGGVLAVLFASLYFHDLMVLCHGLRTPVWFYFRNSFLFSFWMVCLTVRALTKGHFTPLRVGIVGGLLAVWLLLCREEHPSMYSTNRWLLTCALCAALGVLLFLRRQTVLRQRTFVRLRPLAAAGLLLLTFAELTLNAVWTVRQFEAYTGADFAVFVRDGTAAVQKIRETRDDCRIEKTYRRTLNDPMLLGYAGIDHFSSLQDDSFFLLEALGYSPSDSSGTLFTDSLLGIGYRLRRAGDPITDGYRDTGMAVNDIAVWENPYAFPLVFAVDSSLEGIDPAAFGNNTDALENQLWHRISGSEADIVAGGQTDTAALAAFARHAQDAVQDARLTVGGLRATLTLKEDSPVLLTLGYTKQLTVTVDGTAVPVTQAAGGLCQLSLPAGTHSIEAGAASSGLLPGVAVSLCSLALAFFWELRLRHKLKKV